MPSLLLTSPPEHARRRQLLADQGIRHCWVCLCTEHHACPGRCWWVGADLCSSCAPQPPRLACESVDPGMPQDGDFADDDGECVNCGGTGVVAGCFEDTCCCCGDPEDPDLCCAPHKCGWCGGNG